MSDDGTNHRPRAIVTGHGSFPEGIVSAVAQITGRGDLLLPLSNVGLGREEIEAKLREQLVTHGITVVFTDLPGGSATFAVRRIMRDVPSLTLVTGTNLATLIDFVFCDAAPAIDAARHAAEKGRAALTVTSGS
jgi:PTS system N-acetylgalactosamine-specific IIA component